MSPQRKIKAAEIIRDIRDGMSDSGLMEKYKLSAKGLQNLFRQIVDARIMQPSEIFGRTPSYDNWVLLENLRTLPRQPLYLPIPVHVMDRPEIQGTVEEMTERGMRVRDIGAGIDESRTFVLNVDHCFSTHPIVLDTKCRWSGGNSANGTLVAGFEIMDVLQGDLKGLLAVVHAFPFVEVQDAEGESLLADDEDSTETVDLANLYATEVTSSGSFGFRGVTQTWFGKLLQALPIPALLIDQHYNIAFMNQSWGTISPLFKRMQGRPFSSLLPDPAAAAHARALAQTVFSTRKSMSSQAVLEIDAHMKWGRIHFRSVRMGTNRSILLLFEDLTLEREQLLLKQQHNERLLAEIAERRKAQEALLQAERLKAVGELASGVSHNFNNLLQILQGNAHLALSGLQRGDLDGIKANIEEIIQTSDLASGTVRRLQDFARAKPSTTPSEGKVFDFSEMVRQASDMTKIWWKTVPEKAGISVQLVHNLAPDCLVKGREHELFEVAVNLIKNAAEALPGGGEICVDTFIESGHMVLRVKDNGVGISPDNIKRLFEPFFTTKDVQSAGMGLASSYGIVKSHGGTISVQSSLGEGSTFLVRLPSAQGLAQDFRAKPKKFTMRLRILLIDDMQPVTALLSSGLAEYGQTVTTALSGPEGLRLFEEEPHHVVICDLGMPGMNGWDVGESIVAMCREKSIPKPPFVILTGWSDQAEEEERIARAGVDAVIQKPIDIPELLEIIQELVPPSSREAL
jgi:signal transduction histidine kinase/ActR/RegA family two-component response regulator